MSIQASNQFLSPPIYQSYHEVLNFQDMKISSLQHIIKLLLENEYDIFKPVPSADIYHNYDLTTILIYSLLIYRLIFDF